MRAATVAGRTKMPEPITPFTAMAVKPRRPTSRENPGAAGEVMP